MLISVFFINELLWIMRVIFNDQVCPLCGIQIDDGLRMYFLFMDVFVVLQRLFLDSPCILNHFIVDDV